VFLVIVQLHRRRVETAMRTILFEQLSEKPLLLQSDVNSQLATNPPFVSLKPSLKVQEGDAFFQLQIN
jgi:hypothetical protein